MIVNNRLKLASDKENKKLSANRGCPKKEKTIVSGQLNKTARFDVKRKSVVPTKNAKISVLKPTQQESSHSRDTVLKDTVANAHTNTVPDAALMTNNSKQDSFSSFDNLTKPSDSKCSCNTSPGIVRDVPVNGQNIECDQKIDTEKVIIEPLVAKNEILDIANMLESLQLQTPAKHISTKTPKEETKYLNIKMAGDGVCINTDGTCLTVLTPVRASRKVEKGTYFLNTKFIELGVKNVITPVRRSIRNALLIPKDSSVKKHDQIHNLLNDHDFAYVPNDVNLNISNHRLLRRISCKTVA